MKNILSDTIEAQVHILSTDETSELVFSTSKYGGVFLRQYYGTPMIEMGDSYQHIHFTTDEEPKEGDWIIWVKQSYAGDDRYKDYIGKVYKVFESIGLGNGMIELKNFYPPKSIENRKEFLKKVYERHNKIVSPEKLEENAIRAVEQSTSLWLKIGYNVATTDCIKIVATNNPQLWKRLDSDPYYRAGGGRPCEDLHPESCGKIGAEFIETYINSNPRITKVLLQCYTSDSIAVLNSDAKDGSLILRSDQSVIISSFE